jgi:hypothetical protein
MGFLDNIFGNNKKKKPAKKKQSAKKAQTGTKKKAPDTSIKPEISKTVLAEKGHIPPVLAELTLCGSTYAVSNLDMEFKQDISNKNQPDSETYGGDISLSLTDKPDDVIEEWIVDTFRKHDGILRFYERDSKKTYGLVSSIFFEDAYCTKYRKIMNTVTGENTTVLHISPRIIKIGQEEFVSGRKE